MSEMNLQKVIERLKFMRLDAMEGENSEEATSISEMITYLESLDKGCDVCKWLEKGCYYKMACDQHRAPKEASE